LGQFPRPTQHGLHRALAQIRLRERVPIWRLRLIFGAMAMLLSELVMWQNPPGRAWYEWPALLILYVSLGAIILDLVVRFQVYTPAALGIVSGVYGLISASVINHTAFENIPFGLLVRGMGLQVGAGFLALMLFVAVLRGRPPDAAHIAAAAALGVAWGIWIHWWPMQEAVGWGRISVEDGQLWVIAGLALVGALFMVAAPRFGAFRESHFGLYWWEMILVAVPLLVALLVGMFQNVVPFVPLLLPAAILTFCLWSLDFQKSGHEPSILANLMFVAPNLTTYVTLAVVFLLAGALAYPLVAGADSPVGIVLYVVVLGFGSAWLPFASGLIFWSLLRTGNTASRRRARRKRE
jgi:hypothetical protein